jgi:hypothetical protein
VLLHVIFLDIICKVVQPVSRKCVVPACWHNVDRLYPVKQVIKEIKMNVCNS